jgi:ABC-type proline/glycine betaine transport system permease subunit
MLVIAALIGNTGLGQSIYLALVADRLVQGFATERRRKFGL